MIITEKHDIGHGAHWKVERCFLENSIETDGAIYNTIIVKRKIKGDIASNVRCYQRIFNAGLPTIAFYKAEIIGGEMVLIAEDINNFNTIYLSPNSARQIPTVKDDLIRIYQNVLKPYTNMSGTRNTCAQQIEYHWKKNRIKNIIFEKSIYKVIERDMEIASKYKLGLCEDAFFWGYAPDHVHSVKASNIE